MMIKDHVKTLTTTASGLALLVVAIVSINVISSKLNFRMDVTQDRVYSLSEGTRKVLGKLNGETTVKFYFSRSQKELPPMIKTYASRVEEVLGEFASHSGGKLTLEVVDPRPDTDEEEWARKYGLRAMPVGNGEELYFGVVFMGGQKEMAIPYLDVRREELLEYDLAEGLVKLGMTEKPRVGVMSSLSVMGAEPFMVAQGMGQPGWALFDEWRRNYDVTKVETSVKAIPDGIKTLVVVHPKNLSDETLYAIDQFTLRGGRLMVFVDPMSRIDMAENRQAMFNGGGQMPQTSSDLARLFGAWEIEYNAGQLVGDQRRATQINAGAGPISYPLFMSLTEEGINRKATITSQLRNIMWAEGGAVSLKAGSANQFEPLLETSDDSGTVDAQMAGYMPPEEVARALKPDGKKRVMAGILRGKLKSAFTAAPAGTEVKEPFLGQAENDAAVIVFADVDFIHDSNSVRRMNFGGMTMAQPLNANLALVTNAVEFLGGSEDLISIRSRGRVSRPFTRLEELQKTAQTRWQKEEERLSQGIQEVEKKLNEMQAQRGDGNVFTLNAAQQGEIERFREQEREMRRNRREVRRNLREDIDGLGRWLVALNMLVVPLTVAGFGAGVFTQRARRMKKGREDASNQ